jgi:two-component system phosphate regulon response regulator PhoB
MRSATQVQPTFHTNTVPGTLGTAREPARASRAARRPLVLVVDDEPGIVDFLCYALEDHGYRVAVARDGLAALHAIQRALPDFVLTDLMMPNLDGWELCQRLRRQPETRTLPIIGMSAVDPHGAPVDFFLRKPFELDELVRVLDRFAGRVDQRRAGSTRISG